MVRYSPELNICFVLFKDPITKKISAYHKNTIQEANELLRTLEENAKPQGTLRLPYVDN